MRLPTQILVVDAAILIAAARGRGAALFVAVRKVALVTTDRAFEEASRRIGLGMKRLDLLPVLDSLAGFFRVVPLASLGDIGKAQRALRDAVPSRNGSISDAHLIALAWSVDADIWSADRDFAGAGVASWSTANLLRAFARA